MLSFNCQCLFIIQHICSRVSQQTDTRAAGYVRWDHQRAQWRLADILLADRYMYYDKQWSRYQLSGVRIQIMDNQAVQLSTTYQYYPDLGLKWPRSHFIWQRHKVCHCRMKLETSKWDQVALLYIIHHYAFQSQSVVDPGGTCPLSFSPAWRQLQPRHTACSGLGRRGLVPFGQSGDKHAPWRP